MPNPKHHNPGPNRTATAPYNFIPLPEKVVTVKSEEIPDHDRYEHLTGYIECFLTTESPTYTRCAQNLEFFKEFADNPKDIRLNQKDRHEYAQFFNLDNIQRPVIPGSSLRGMVRSLVEIVGFGKMQWIGNEPKITLRAVAAKSDDPLKEPYERALGRFGRNVQSGYLVKKSNDWFIQPALKPTNLNLPEQASYLKVKDRNIQANAIPGFKRFNNPNYLPQYHNVSFEVEVYKGKRGNHTHITQIAGENINHTYKGVLVCTGNMLETSGGTEPSPRKNYALVLERDTNAALVRIPEQVIADYIDGLTPFQREQPFDQNKGCLKDGRPIFYVEQKGEVVAFGHTPNFRIPAWLSGTKRAATPLDFVPPDLRRVTDIDLAEAIFGYTPEGERKEGRAGRVFFTDAHYQGDQDGIWLKDGDGLMPPRILSGPKPTTFQHYLVQDKEQGHDPNEKKTLAHYGVPTPEKTVIRGHKLYWHKGPVNEQDIREEGNEDPDNTKDGWEKDTQHTQIKPVKAGVIFSFKIYFENFRDYELGALLWALDLPEDCRHKIGMGKPLGMGAVKIRPKLILSNRSKRYGQLFEGKNWAVGERNEPDIAQFKQAFEQFVLKGMDDSERKRNFSEVERIKMLLTMLKWPGPNSEQTRYMTIDGEDGQKFRNRHVLPDPLHLEGQSQTGRTSQPRQSHPSKSERKQSPLPAKQSVKPTVAGEYFINYTFTAKIEVTWNEKTKKSETRMPNGAPAILDMSRKAAARLHGRTIQLVVSDFIDGIYYLKQP